MFKEMYYSYEDIRLTARILYKWNTLKDQDDKEHAINEIMLHQIGSFNFDFAQFVRGSIEQFSKKYELVECPYCDREFIRWIDEEWECKTRFCSDDCREGYEEDEGF